MQGFRALHFVGPCVTVFGSARFKADHPYYAIGREPDSPAAAAGWVTAVAMSAPGLTPRAPLASVAPRS